MGPNAMRKSFQKDWINASNQINIIELDRFISKY